MRLHCPCCGAQFPLEAGFADEDGKRLAVLFADMEPRFARAVMSYLRLFSPPKRAMRLARAIRLVEELVALVQTGTVSRDARTKQTAPATVAMWTAGIEQMLAQRDRLQLPLESHNYLRAVVWGIATDPQQQTVNVYHPSHSPAMAVTQPNRLEQISKITGDLSLGLITKEEAQRRLAALGAGAVQNDG